MDGRIDPTSSPEFVDGVVRTLLEEYLTAHDRISSAVDAGHLTPDGVSAAWESASQRGHWAEVTKAVEAWVGEHPRSVAGSTDQVRRSLAAPPSEPMDRLIFELSAARSWARTKPVLDSVESEYGAVAAAGEILGRASGEELPVLLQELEPYLAARGVSDARASLDDALAQAAPQFAEARTREARAGEAARVVEANLSQVTRAMTARSAPDYVRDGSFLNSVEAPPAP